MTFKSLSLVTDLQYDYCFSMLCEFMYRRGEKVEGSCLMLRIAKFCYKENVFLMSPILDDIVKQTFYS